MKKKLLDSWILIVAFILSSVSLINLFGFKISPAITESRYQIDLIKQQEKFNIIEERIGFLTCQILEAKQDYYRAEEIKYQSYAEVKIEEELYGALSVYHQAKTSLQKITHKLKDIESDIAKHGC